MAEQFVAITDDTFDETAGSVGWLFLEFKAAWCSPCAALEAVLSQVAKERSSMLTIGQADISMCPGLVERFSVSSTPTLVLLRDGKEIKRIFGARPKRHLDELLNEHFEVAN